MGRQTSKIELKRILECDLNSGIKKLYKRNSGYEESPVKMANRELLGFMKESIEQASINSGSQIEGIQEIAFNEIRKSINDVKLSTAISSYLDNVNVKETEIHIENIALVKILKKYNGIEGAATHFSEKITQMKQNDKQIQLVVNKGILLTSKIPMLKGKHAELEKLYDELEILERLIDESIRNDTDTAVRNAKRK